MENQIIINSHKLTVKEYKGKRVVTLREIDEVHERPEGTARKRFNDNRKHFIEDTDYFVRNTDEAKSEFGLIAPNGLILITESGYLMLVKSLSDDLAWEVQRQLVNVYFRAKEIQSDFSSLSPQLQLLINMEVEQKRQAAALAEVNGRLDNICEIVSLDANAWRDRSKKIIVQIAEKWGGAAYIQDVHNELYRLLEQTAHVDLKRRVENRRRRMAEEGVCRSRRDKLNRLDIIADDPKLTPIYLDLVKRMAIKNNVEIQGILEEQAR